MTARPAPDKLAAMKAYRARLLRFDDDSGAPLYDEDGLLVIGPDATGQSVVRAAGNHATLIDRFAGVVVEDLRPRLIAPGFIDLHVHYPQIDVIGSPADGLLPWLEHYTFPHEARFADPVHARAVAEVFFDELQRHGVTTALTFATSHVASVDAAFEAARFARLDRKPVDRPSMPAGPGERGHTVVLARAHVVHARAGARDRGIQHSTRHSFPGRL